MANTTFSTTDLTGVTLSGGNLTATANIGTGAAVRAADRQLAGKWYWETTINTGTANPTGAGIATAAPTLANLGNNNLLTTFGFCIYYHNNTVYRNGTQLSGIAPGAPANGNVICHALDLDNRLYYTRLGAAGNWNGSGTANPATQAGGIDISSFAGGFAVYPVVSMGATSDAWTANFGDSAFSGSVPSGFTSGFTAGASIPTNAVATQLALEQWARGVTNQAQMTQVALEQWATVATGNVQAIMTQMAMEQWASVTLSAAVAAQPTVWVMA